MSQPGSAPGPGNVWEARAREHLRDSGLTIIAQGYRCRLGELDLIACDDEQLIIVEVRARARTAFGTAVETVGINKQRRIILATRHFLMRHPAWVSRRIRFDVIAFDDIDQPAPALTWLKNAFLAY
jgi:putative endonuclease